MAATLAFIMENSLKNQWLLPSFYWKKTNTLKFKLVFFSTTVELENELLQIGLSIGFSALIQSLNEHTFLEKTKELSSVYGSFKDQKLLPNFPRGWPYIITFHLYDGLISTGTQDTWCD
jgi:hypothetical protein